MEQCAGTHGNWSKLETWSSRVSAFEPCEPEDSFIAVLGALPGSCRASSGSKASLAGASTL